MVSEWPGVDYARYTVMYIWCLTSCITSQVKWVVFRVLNTVRLSSCMQVSSTLVLMTSLFFVIVFYHIPRSLSWTCVVWMMCSWTRHSIVANSCSFLFSTSINLFWSCLDLSWCSPDDVDELFYFASSLTVTERLSLSQITSLLCLMTRVASCKIEGTGWSLQNDLIDLRGMITMT